MRLATLLSTLSAAPLLALALPAAAQDANAAGIPRCSASVTDHCMQGSPAGASARHHSKQHAKSHHAKSHHKANKVSHHKKHHSHKAKAAPAK